MIVSVPLRGIGSEKLQAGIGTLKVIKNDVSVPLRGIGSEKQLRAVKTKLGARENVSVPLRGIGSEKQSRTHVKTKAPGTYVFPSPCGE